MLLSAPFFPARAAFSFARGDCMAVAAAVEHCLHPVQAVRFLGATAGTRIQPDSLLLQLHHCFFKTVWALEQAGFEAST